VLLRLIPGGYGSSGGEHLFRSDSRYPGRYIPPLT
jgi:hypothetical protein